MSQMAQSTRPVGAQVPEKLYLEFKFEVVRLGLKLQDVVTAMLELFLEDQEFRARVLRKLGISGNEFGQEDPVPM